MTMTGSSPAQYTKEQAGESVKVAIEVGYRHIDGAAMYGNEVQVGEGIRCKIADGTVTREDIFYTGKLWNNNHDPERVRIGLEQSLRDLQLDYLDLFLIHTPMGFQSGDNLFPTDENGKAIYHNTDIRDTWKALEACKDMIDQNSPKLLEDPVLNTVAKKLNRTPAQVALRYLLDRGVVVLAKSFTPQRIKENFQVFDFELNDEDVEALDGCNKNLRYLTMDVWSDHPNYPFHDEY
ncbi:hypothetical protein GDO81_022700 [Engystomops pustulosus]|uniref:NADP-dependent oxidoreductase domain-containing protein n=1 Tax=Engystomops pustulosus TaxID=76066 RepID=A0AAV6ZEN1_ENGPU|nr:hypothetical protein GDO81_022700 [Engystomops pustulosus]